MQKNGGYPIWTVDLHGGSEPISVRQQQGEQTYRILWNQDREEQGAAKNEEHSFSNIRLQDYEGPESCRQCHQENYDSWHHHAHRLMNALATEENVKGDFSGNATIEYQGGVASFYREEEDYYMKLERPPITRVYRILRTVGSRFFQSYAGVLVEGPDAADHPIRKVPHHLPFSYWLDRQMWVPEVHIYLEVPDKYRLDVFGEEGQVIDYDKRCSACHTTRPVGDWLVSAQGILRAASFTPESLTFQAFDHLQETHPDSLDKLPETDVTGNDILEVFKEVSRKPATEHAATLGISCEACHNGAREHVQASTAIETQSKPRFFPTSRHLKVEGVEEPSEMEQFCRPTSANINWICARCHSGNRPYYAGGMSTWNSTEASDAFKGHCYKSTEGRETMTCLSCHDPHEAIGKSWSATGLQDDMRCMKCHSEYLDEKVAQEHTHHAPDSEGARCMNCHMPKINEGLQDMVRTHMIFSPTNAAMIEANQPNACNMCHLEKSIDWTLDYLGKWYGKTYDDRQINSNYARRDQAVGIGWLKSKHEPTRLVAIESIGRENAKWAMPELIKTLNDPFLINREFAQSNLQRMLGIDLADEGYLYYMPESERLEAIEKIEQIIDVHLERKTD